MRGYRSFRQVVACWLAYNVYNVTKHLVVQCTRHCIKVVCLDKTYNLLFVLSSFKYLLYVLLLASRAVECVISQP